MHVCCLVLYCSSFVLTMGWTTSTSEAKRWFIQKACMVVTGLVRSVYYSEFKALVCDTSAWARSVMPWNATTELTPSKMMTNMFWPSLMMYKNDEGEWRVGLPRLQYCVFCFDDKNIPEMRRIFHQEERYKTELREPRADEVKIDGRIYRRGEEPMPDEEIDLIKPDSVPYPWARMWNNHKAKERLWSVIVQCLKDKIAMEQHYYPNTIFVIEDNMCGKWVYPVVDQGNTERIEYGMHELNYGEADSKALQWSAYLDACGIDRVLLATNDWDLVLAQMLYDTRVVTLQGKVYVSAKSPSTPFQYSDDKVALSQKSVVKKSWCDQGYTEAYEFIENATIVKQYKTMDQRYEAAIIMMCDGGVDYCKGVARFGFTEQKILSFHRAHLEGKTRPFLKTIVDPKRPLRRGILFDAQMFLKNLRDHGPKSGSKVLNGSPDDFNAEIHKLLWCVSYFAGWNIQDLPAGPCLPDYDVRFLESGHATMKDIYDKPSTMKSIEVFETSDVFDLLQWPFPLVNLYTPKQAQLIISTLYGGMANFSNKFDKLQITQ